MTSPFRIELTGAASALGVHVSEATELPAAVEMLGLHPPRSTVLVIGGAASLEEARIDGLRPVFATGFDRDDSSDEHGMLTGNPGYSIAAYWQRLGE